ncbi:MAG TPA: UbiX family flavin prenyltransferase [Phnomibacter sp.]|nr:UbiX family flavin prenyltransferase [Phnomibacter sp.]
MMHKIVVAVTGASGSIYARLLLDKLCQLRSQIDELSVVLSPNAIEVGKHELGSDVLQQYPVKYFDKNDFNAPFASGSGRYNCMVIVPCSMGTLGRVAHGVSNDLVTRAADVMLKERRRLILAVREMPYNLLHIKNMELVTLAGGIICPCTPSFYSKPTTVEEVAATVTDRLIDLIGLQQDTYRWGNSH